MKNARALSLIPLLIMFLVAPSPLRAQALTDLLRTNPKFLETFREVIATPRQTTVRIQNDGKEAALGVIVGADGWILTKAFELKGKITCRMPDGMEREAKLVGVHTVHDLAVLKVQASHLPVAKLAPSKRLPVGSWVASAGLSADPIAVGVVSVPTRDVKIKGPPLAAAELAKIGYLGVALETAGNAGVRIAQVIPNTAAAKGGLKNSDVILSVSGVAVDGQEAFQNEMVKRRPGDSITLRIRRGEDELNLDVTLQPRPQGDNRGEVQNHMGSELSARRSGYPTILTHDSVVRPTDCGGPVVDLDGNIVGINISRAGRTETWAVPTEVIQPLLADLKSGKLAPAERIAAPQSR